MTDVIGISITDKPNVRPEIWALLFDEFDVPYSDAQRIINIEASNLLNIYELIGASGKGYVLYAIGTSRRVLNKALRHFGLSNLASLYNTPAGYLGNGVTCISIPGILPTDTITAQTTNQPACTVAGRIDISNGHFVCGVRVARDGLLIGFYPCAELVGPIAYNAYRGQKRLPDGLIIGDSLHYRSANGFDLLTLGYSPIAIQRRA